MYQTLTTISTPASRIVGICAKSAVRSTVVEARAHHRAALTNSITDGMLAIVSSTSAAESSDIIRRLADIGAEPVGYMPEDAARFLRNEIALWSSFRGTGGLDVHLQIIHASNTA